MPPLSPTDQNFLFAEALNRVEVATKQVADTVAQAREVAVMVSVTGKAVKDARAAIGCLTVAVIVLAVAVVSLYLVVLF